MERCAHTEAIDKHIREQDAADAIVDQEISDMQDSLKELVLLLTRNFDQFAKNSPVDRKTLKDVVLEDLKELL